MKSLRVARVLALDFAASELATALALPDVVYTFATWRTQAVRWIPRDH